MPEKFYFGARVRVIVEKTVYKGEQSYVTLGDETGTVIEASDDFPEVKLDGTAFDGHAFYFDEEELVLLEQPAAAPEPAPLELPDELLAIEEQPEAAPAEEPVAKLGDLLKDNVPAPEPVVEVLSPEAAAQQVQSLPRVFKTGATRIVEDESMRDKSIEQVQVVLSATYPELKHATIREHRDNGIHLVEFLPRAGTKG